MKITAKISKPELAPYQQAGTLRHLLEKWINIKSSDIPFVHSITRTIPKTVGSRKEIK